jgi:hypothetical protein
MAYTKGDKTKELALACFDIEIWLDEQYENEVNHWRERQGYLKTIRKIRALKKKFHSKIKAGLI